MSPLVTSWAQVALIVFGYLLGVYFQNKRLDDFRITLHKRFDDLRLDLTKRLDESKTELHKYLDAKFQAMDVRFKSMEDRLDRIEGMLLP